MVTIFVVFFSKSSHFSSHILTFNVIVFIFIKTIVFTADINI